MQWAKQAFLLAITVETLLQRNQENIYIVYTYSLLT